MKNILLIMMYGHTFLNYHLMYVVILSYNRCSIRLFIVFFHAITLYPYGLMMYNVNVNTLNVLGLSITFNITFFTALVLQGSGNHL